MKLSARRRCCVAGAAAAAAARLAWLVRAVFRTTAQQALLMRIELFELPWLRFLPAGALASMLLARRWRERGAPGTGLGN
jgi:hypothetical protein